MGKPRPRGRGGCPSERGLRRVAPSLDSEGLPERLEFARLQAFGCTSLWLAGSSATLAGGSRLGHGLEFVSFGNRGRHGYLSRCHRLRCADLDDVRDWSPLQLLVFRQPEDMLDCGLEPDNRTAIAPRGGKAPLLDQAFQRALAAAQSSSDLCLR